MQTPKKSPKLLIATLLIVFLGTGLAYFLVKDADFLGENSSARVPSSSSSMTSGSYRVQTETETIEGSPSSVSLGFNNAEQVVETDGGTNMVWVVDQELQLVTRTSGGDVSIATTVAEGPITLPALARSEDLVGVAWVEQTGRSTSIMSIVSTDGGSTFGPETTLGTGSGVSLAASGGTLIAVWHDDSGSSTSEILLSKYDSTASSPSWTSTEQVDESTAEPLWASVTAEDENIYVTWRDNRDGTYNVWLRRYTDGAWQDEQNLTTLQSGDPDICVSGNNVAVAHHGKGKITLLQSTDGGASFATGLNVGNGYFAHLSCTEQVVAVAWESTTGSSKATGKEVGWAIYDNSGSNLGSGTIADGSVAACTVHATPGAPFVEFLWLKVGTEPLVGELRHEVLTQY